MRALTAFAISAAALALSGCQKTVALMSCEKYAGTYPVQYVGGALGRGELEVRTAAGRKDLIEAKMTLWDDTGTDAVIRLGGPGSCEDGILRVRFGGGDHPNARVKVLGGTLVAVPEPKLFDGLFGGWEVRVLMKEKNTERTLQGYLRQKPKEAAADAGNHGDPHAKPAS